MKTTGKVSGIVSNLVTVTVDGPVAENELCYIDLSGTRLLAEVIKVNGDKASVQVFESTRGLKNGDSVEFLGRMLEATLGPGLLSSIYDGLQNDLTTMEGVFLKRGEYTEALDHGKLWEFTPIAKPGDKVVAADWLGEVREGWLPHKIMVPFAFEGEYTVKEVAPAGEYNIDKVVAVLTDASGEDVDYPPAHVHLRGAHGGLDVVLRGHAYVLLQPGGRLHQRYLAVALLLVDDAGVPGGLEGPDGPAGVVAHTPVAVHWEHVGVDAGALYRFGHVLADDHAGACPDDGHGPRVELLLHLPERVDEGLLPSEHQVVVPHAGGDDPHVGVLQGPGCHEAAAGRTVLHDDVHVHVAQRVHRGDYGVRTGVDDVPHW